MTVEGGPVMSMGRASPWTALWPLPLLGWNDRADDIAGLREAGLHPAESWHQRERLGVRGLSLELTCLARPHTELAGGGLLFVLSCSDNPLTGSQLVR